MLLKISKCKLLSITLIKSCIFESKQNQNVNITFDENFKS